MILPFSATALVVGHAPGLPSADDPAPVPLASVEDPRVVAPADRVRVFLTGQSCHAALLPASDHPPDQDLIMPKGLPSLQGDPPDNPPDHHVHLMSFFILNAFNGFLSYNIYTCLCPFTS